MASSSLLNISGIIVDIILFFIIAGNAVLGYRKGLVGVIFRICSSVIAIILVLILYKPVSNYIINQTSLSSKLENIFEENLEYLFDKENIETTEELQNTNSMDTILKVFVGDEIGTLLDETVENLIQYISSQASCKIIKVLVFLILFAIIRLLLYVFKNYIELVAKLPIIRLFNGSGGMIYGILKGFLIIYILFAIISIISPLINDTIIIKAILNAPIGSKMFNNNIILNLIF